MTRMLVAVIREPSSRRGGAPPRGSLDDGRDRLCADPELRPHVIGKGDPERPRILIGKRTGEPTLDPHATCRSVAPERLEEELVIFPLEAAGPKRAPAMPRVVHEGGDVVFSHLGTIPGGVMRRARVTPYAARGRRAASEGATPSAPVASVDDR